MINENIAHLIAPDGTKFQVLNEDGTDWDEAATYALLNTYIDSLPIEVPKKFLGIF